MLTLNVNTFAQFELQEQRAEILRKNKVSEIKLKFITDSLKFITKSELYNQFGFNTEDKIYDRRTGKRVATYKYSYINDTFLLEKETYFGDTINWVIKTLIDFDNYGKKIKENFIAIKNKVTAYTNFSYDKKNRLKSFKHVRKGYGSLLNFENNLWHSSPTKYITDTIYEKDTIKKITSRIDKSNSMFDFRYSYNKDNTIKEIKQTSPLKLKVIYTYDKNGNNTSRIKKQDKAEFKTYECEFDSINRPIVFHNFFESDAKIIGIGGSMKVNKNGHLTTKVFYKSNGLIDYKEQYLNSHYLGKLEYEYK